MTPCIILLKKVKSLIKCIFLLTLGYAAHTSVTRVIDGGEPAEFKSLFKLWKDKDATTKLTFTRKTSVTTVQTKFDAKVLHENPQMVSPGHNFPCKKSFRDRQ